MIRLSFVRIIFIPNSANSANDDERSDEIDRFIAYLMRIIIWSAQKSSIVSQLHWQSGSMPILHWIQHSLNWT